MNLPPVEPPASLTAYAPVAVRQLTVFGAPVELVLVPGRNSRSNRADGPRPAFAANPAGRIVAQETYWRGDGLALTPNKFPFADQHRILWPIEPRREPDVAMWCAACAWSDRAPGTALINTIGAAATIARAHAHLTPERLGFLAGLPERAGPPDLVELPAGVELVQKDLPCCILGVRGGDAEARGRALAVLNEARLTPAANVCVQDGTAWLFPRNIEIPIPHFPFALGAAELWGRWCFADEATFTAATAGALERAFVMAGRP